MAPRPPCPIPNPPTVDHPAVPGEHRVGRADAAGELDAVGREEAVP